jgi:hypothetical protein
MSTFTTPIPTVARMEATLAKPVDLMMVGALLGGYSPNLVEEVVFSEARLITFTDLSIGL